MQGPSDGFIIWYSLLKVSSSAYDVAHFTRPLKKKKSTICKIKHKMYMLNTQRPFSEGFCLTAMNFFILAEIAA